MVSRLQEENRRIQKDKSPDNGLPPQLQHISLKDDVNCIVTNSQASSGTDFHVLQRLRSQVDKYRNELKIKDNELQLKSSEVENVNIISYYYCLVLQLN